MLSLLAALSAPLPATTAEPDYPNIACEGEAPGYRILNPPELKSVNGVLNLTLNLVGGAIANKDPVCWIYQLPTAHGLVWSTTPPTLHLKPGDRLILKLWNHLSPPGQPVMNPNGVPYDVSGPNGRVALGTGGPHGGRVWNGQYNAYPLPCGQPQTQPLPSPNPVTGQIYGTFRSPWNETNMHFHGLPVTPEEPGDDVVHVLLCPTLKAAAANWFEFNFVIGTDVAPGTYWYHPHPHGESDNQLLEQLTGVIIIDTATKSIPDTMFNRVIVVRDAGKPGQLRSNDEAYRKAIFALRMRQPRLADIRAQIAKEGMPKPDFYHRNGGYPYADPQQCPGSSIRRNAYNVKELIINQVPLPADPYGTTGLPFTSIKAGETQYIRFANTSADTILQMIELVNGVQVPLQITDRDGVPIVVDQNGVPTWQPVPMNDIWLPPAGRTEFYITGTNPGDQIVLRTNDLTDSNALGCLGDLTFGRNLMVFNVGAQVQGKVATMPAPVLQIPKRLYKDLWHAKPVRQRTFAFTEYVRPEGPLQDFYVTELSNPAAVEHPFETRGPADVYVQQGTVEDWTFLDYTQEVHELHMHQIHYLVLQSPGVDLGLGQLLDTAQVPFGRFKKPGDTSGNDFIPGAIKLRMDFRDPNIAGEFVFHCHILAHEDNGMMAKIEVLPYGAFLPNGKVKPQLANGDAVPATPLVDQSGKRFSLASFKGKTLVVAFGYTRCGGEHGCALTAAKLAKLQTLVHGEPVQLVELTVDPKRDDPASLRRYGSTFGEDPSRWQLATGKPSDVIGLDWVLGEKVLAAHRNGEIPHGDEVLIVDANGRIADRLDGEDWTPSELAGRTLAVVKSPVRLASNGAAAGRTAGGAAVLALGVLAVIGRRRRRKA